MPKLPVLFMNVVVIGCLAAAVNSVPMSPSQWLMAFFRRGAPIIVHPHSPHVSRSPLPTRT
jgi:hypothetical protein